MPAQPRCNRNFHPPPVIVLATGLVHRRDRAELDWLKKHDQGRYALLISSTFIKCRTAELAREILGTINNNPSARINLLFVLRGAVFFGCNLAREIHAAGGMRIGIHYVSASSYGKSSHSSGYCRLAGSLHALRGKAVIIVEDICDTGLTIETIKSRLLADEYALSVKACVLMDKPARRLKRLRAKLLTDFVGFRIPNVFVAGCGLDDGGAHRELPFVIYRKNQG